MKKITSFLNRSIISWAFFDFANSSYTTVIITALYNRYFVSVVALSLLSYEADRLWLNTLALSYLIASFISPIWGVLADVSFNKKRYLFVSYLLCVTPTFLLFFTKSGDISLAITLIIISNIGFSLSENIISSFLPELAKGKNIGKVSGFGWGFGYLGGILSLLGAIFIIDYFSYLGDNLGLRIAFLFTASFFTLSALPTFIFLKENKDKKNANNLSLVQTIKLSYKKLFNTLFHIRGYSELVKLLICYFFYYAGLATVITYSAIYAQRVFNFGNTKIIILIIVVNISSAIGSFFFGFLQDKIGIKKTLELILILWIALFIGIFYTTTSSVFFAMAVCIGLLIGAVQSTTRALVGIFSPAKHHGEFYGLWGFFGKISAIVGLYSFGFVLELFKKSEYALLCSIIFFVLAFIVIKFVNENKGIKQAREV